MDLNEISITMNSAFSKSSRAMDIYLRNICFRFHVSDASELLKISNRWELEKKNLRRDFGIYRDIKESTQTPSNLEAQNHSNIWKVEIRLKIETEKSQRWENLNLRHYCSTFNILTFCALIISFYILIMIILCINHIFIKKKISDILKIFTRRIFFKNSNNWANFIVSNSKQ